MRYCPRCYLTGDDIGTCANFAIGCPPAVEAAPEDVAHIGCTACGKEVAVPIANIMRGKTGQLSNCSTSQCPAKLIPPVAATPVTALPAPLSEEKKAAAPEAAKAGPQGGTSANAKPASTKKA
jgi:hypothetical protein